MNNVTTPRPNTDNLSNRQEDSNLQNEASTTEKMRLKAHQAVDGAADRAVNVERKLRDEAAVAQVKLGEKKEAAQEQLEETMASLEAYIRQNPMKAAGIAFGAGLVVSRLLRR